MKQLITIVLCVVCCFTIQAQTRSKQYEEYIKKYRDLAVEEMKRYHIPASITLAPDSNNPCAKVMLAGM